MSPTPLHTGSRFHPPRVLLVAIASMLLCSSARAITFANQTVTSQAPPASGCAVPPSQSSFLTTDGTVYLYFEATVASSDALTNDWLAPDGTSVSPGSWNSGSGDFCFVGGTLSISSLPASQLGSWQARVFDNGNLLFSIPFTVSAPAGSGASYYFPQLAFGGGFQTTLTYVNYSPQSVSCQTTFYSDTGASLQVPFSDGSVSQRTDNLAAGTDIHVQTIALAGSSVAQGWAQVQCSGPIKASLLYRLYSGSTPQGEASVNAATTPTTEFVTFAQTQTGIAYANPSALTLATVTVTALDSAGFILGTTSFPLAPHAHGSANIGPQLGLNSFTGSIQITSTVPIVTLSLNAEAFPVFSSLPPGDLPTGTSLATGNGGGASTNGTFSYYFPQLAFGGGFQTTLTYVNYSPQSVSCQTMFYSDAGGSLQVPFSGGSFSQRTDNLGSGADIHVQTSAAAGSSVMQGWAQVQCSGPIKASLLYRLYSGSTPEGEASVNAETVPTTEFVTFAQTQTGIAYANPSSAAATVTVTALNSAGGSLGTTSFPLAPNAHGSANIGPLLGLSSFTGSIQITSTVPIVTLSLNAEVFPVFSSLPPGDLPTGTPLATGNGGGGGGTSPPVISSFSASPSSIQAGQSSTLSWSVQNATSLSIDNGIGAVSGSSISVSPASTTSYTLTAGNANGSTSASVTVTVSPAGGGSPSPISITSFSNASPLPLSPLTINTTGINPSNAVNVTFTDNAGYTVTTPAVTVTGAGSIMVATPLYMNTLTGQIGPATLSVTVSQGSATSSAVSLNVQDVPPLSTYGTSLGQISHAVLIFDGLVLGQQLNQLQAYQALPGNTIDTTAAQTTLNTVLNAVVQARSDVDNVMLNNADVIQNGTQPNGTSIQFDQNSLDMMDRIHALFLTQTFGTLPSSYITTGNASPPQSRAILLSSHTGKPAGASTALSGAAPLPRESDKDVSKENPDAAGSTFSGLVAAMEATLGVKDLVTGYQQTQSSCVSPCVPWIQQVQANAQVMSGINGLLDGLQGSGFSDATKTLSQNIGIVGAVLQDVQVVGDVAAQLSAFTVGELTGNQELVNVAVQAMDQNQSKAIGAAEDLTLALFGGPGFSEGVQQISTTLSFAKTLYDLGESAQEQANATPGQIATEVQSLPGVSNDFGTLDGTVDISNPAGIASAPTGLDLISGCIEFSTVADPSGDYQILVPLNVSGFDYADADLEAFDPVSLDYISDETVDIGSLSPTNSLTLPVLAGSCDDTDASDPDSDDPDCDLRKSQPSSTLAHLPKQPGDSSRTLR